MQQPDRVTRLVDAFGRAASYLYLVVVAITAYEVGMRYVFNAPTIWVHELAVALAATCFVIGGPLVHQRQQHITISVVYERMGPAVQRWARALSSLLALVFAILLTYAAWLQAALALKSGETSGTALNWPIPVYLKTLFVVAATVLALQSLLHLIRDVGRLRARDAQA
jgi:TRAP-type mannitol/chloroaromatic compound transport system permease small subunit